MPESLQRRDKRHIAEARYSCGSIYSAISEQVEHPVQGYTVVDLRANYRINRKVTISAGIDNVNNEKYWVFHPMPQRTYFTQIRFVH